jgi:predicted signal transduction protein with EAL and GGDEF domain
MSADPYGQGTPGETSDVDKLTRRLRRETAARLQAEAIAEHGLRDLYQRQQQIALLEAIAVAANQATQVDQAMAFAIREICRHIEWPLGHALIATDDGDFRTTRLWHSVDSERFAAFRAMSESMLFTRGNDLAGRIVASGLPVLVVDLSGDPDFPRARAARQAGLQAALGFPVFIANEVVAVLEFFAGDVPPLDENLLRLMTQIGMQLGRVLERQRARDDLQHNALHDSLTQLANRALFLSHVHTALNRAKRNKRYGFAVLFIDLDRFKTINDSLGHLVGDKLIISVAQRLTASLRNIDVISHEWNSPRSQLDNPNPLAARLGGDEFAILLDNMCDASDAIRVAERLQSELARPVMIDGREIHSTASIGIALSGSGYQNANDILRDADTAMYRAKAEGRARWELFDQGMRERAVAVLQLEADLHRALERNEFSLHYQPIVSASDGAIQGFEALIRWQHPERGWVSPVEFIPVAEEIGLIAKIGAWVLREACRQCALWHAACPRQPPLTISVNLSALQLAQPDLCAQVAEVLRQTALAPASLKLEITESAVMRDPERSHALLLELRQLGVKISLDDFGTGYSSLSQLRRLPLDTLKIDRSFVSDMDSDDEKRNIAKLIVALAQLLGMSVVAEGAETEREVMELNAMGCEYVQGYYFYPPLDAAAAGQALSAVQLRRD